MKRMYDSSTLQMDWQINKKQLKVASGFAACYRDGILTGIMFLFKDIISIISVLVSIQVLFFLFYKFIYIT